MWLRLVLCGMLALGAGVDAPAQAAQKLTKAESRIQIEFPELAGFREGYGYAQSADYVWEHYAATFLPRSGAYPSFSVILDQVAPTHYFGRQPTIDEAYLAQRWASLKGKMSDVVAAPGGGNVRLRTVRFRAEGAPCVAFEAYLGSPDIRHGYQDLVSRQKVVGYFCNMPGKALNDSDVAHILSTVKVVNPEGAVSLPGAARSRLSSAP